MRTLAVCLDALGSGQLPRLGDLPMQWFKALKLAVKDKGWTIASQLKITDSTVGLPGEEGPLVVAWSARLTQKVLDVKKKLGSAAGWDTGRGSVQRAGSRLRPESSRSSPSNE